MPVYMTHPSPPETRDVFDQCQRQIHMLYLLSKDVETLCDVYLVLAATGKKIHASPVIRITLCDRHDMNHKMLMEAYLRFVIWEMVTP